VHCGLLGLIVGCPPGGLVKVGGTVPEVTALLNSYAALMKSFDSPGGNALLTAFATKIGGLSNYPLIQQQLEDLKDGGIGLQLSALTSVASTNSQAAVTGMVDDVLKNNGAKFSEAINKVVTKLEDRRNATTDPNKIAAIDEHLRRIKSTAPLMKEAVRYAIVAPFGDPETGTLRAAPDSKGKPYDAKTIVATLYQVAAEQKKQNAPQATPIPASTQTQKVRFY
jgi:hypothetical protein